MNPLAYRNEWNAMLISARYKKPLDKPDWYKVENVSDEEASILLYDYVGWPFNSALDFVKALSDMKQPKITIRINSPGGDVWDANAIFNAIKSHPSKPITRIEAIAASAASYIAVAGSQKQAYKNSIIMIHEPRVYVGVNQYELDDTKELLMQVSDMLIDMYADNTSVGKREIKAMMKGDDKKDGTWMNAKVAKEKGFIDSIIEAGKPIAATEYFSIFNNLPDEFKGEVGKKVLTEREIERGIRDVFNLSENKAKAIIAGCRKADGEDDSKELKEILAAARKLADAIK